MNSEAFTIRQAEPSDVQRINELSEVLGYPSPPESTRARLERILGKAEHAIFVALSSDGGVIGWIHGFLYLLLVEDLQCFIGGLVVDPKFQRLGVGRGLLRSFEEWAAQQGGRAVRVNSNVIREDARVFYEREGYTLIKQQRAFFKAVSG
jgi:GNAT superfamily N-acetyltransferase